MQTTAKFFSLGDKIIQNILTEFRKEEIIFSLIAGGGYGYDSLKYHNSNKLGDIDLICVLESKEQIGSILKNADLLERIGYEKVGEKTNFYPKDLELLEKNFISIVRFSGTNSGLKTTLNFTTYEKLREAYVTKKTNQVFKIAHGNHINHIIISTGTDGSGMLMPLIHPEVSSWYGDKTKHFIVPDYTWVKVGQKYHAGILTDWIGKGRIVHDNEERELGTIQDSILMFLASHASSDIREAKTWHKMFASNNYFSPRFKEAFNQKINNICLSLKNITDNGSNLGDLIIDRNIVMTFADRSLYQTSFMSQQSRDLIIDKTEQTQLLTEILTRDMTEGLDIDTKMRTICAEAKRLSVLYTLALSEKEYKLPKNNSVSNLYLTTNDEFLLLDNELNTYNYFDYITSLVEEDFSNYQNYTPSSVKLADIILDMRRMIYEKFKNANITS